MPSLFLPPSSFSSTEIILKDEKAHYLTNVLRLKKGQPVTLLDGQGSQYHARCVSFTKKEVHLCVISSEKAAPQSTFSVTLAQAVVKQPKMDLIIEKATELGVNKIVPLITERTQTRGAGSRLTRWNSIALSAAQQSSRVFIPEIHPPLSFKDFLHHPYSGIIFWEKKESGTLKESLKSFHNHDTIALIIGPEGGFTEEEIHMAETHSFTTASLGPTILRAETAALSALSIVQYELGHTG